MVTHGVVTPNIVAPMSGFFSTWETKPSVAFAIPAIPAAAFVRIFSEIPLIPAMSTTEYIIAMSVVPTYGRVSPEATVETRSLGTPTGRACIAAEMREEPPEPPIPRIPWSLPSS